MKTLIIFIVLVSFGCSSPKSNSPVTKTDTTALRKTARIDNSKFYIATDSIVIASEHFDTLIYLKDEFNDIVDNFPSLYESTPEYPDISYAKSGYFKEFINTNGEKKQISFQSEIGKDEYYILYSYFLKKRNQDKNLNSRRENIISIYQDINDIFSLLRHGGTFYGHQFTRINGYAEYAIYQYKEFEDIFNRQIDIKEQKKLYLSLLKQIIKDELEVDDEIPDRKSKVRQQEEILKYVDHLDDLIVDNFYLKKAIEFESTNY